MLKILRTHGFIIPVVVFLAIFAGVWVTGYLLAGHNATYPLDDTYIHIALATVARAQIDKKAYAAEMLAQGVKEILKFGLAFRGKRIECKM